MTGVLDRLDRYQREHRWPGLTLAVVYKLVDDQETSLAAMLTYYGMVSLFPLLLLLTTCLGFALAGDPTLQQSVLHSALAQFPVIGDQLGHNVTSLQGSTTGLIVGIAGSLYGGLGVSLAIQNAMNKIWAIPRAERPDLLRAYRRGMALLAVFGLDIVATTALTSITTALEAAAPIGIAVRAAATAASVALNIALVLVAYRVMTFRPPPARSLLPGALVASLLWQLLLAAGTYLVGHQLSRTNATYGLFAIVLGLLSWIYLGALILIVGAEINVVRLRSLLAPDPTAGALTPADQRAYSSYSETERQKSYQVVHTAFGSPASANRYRRPQPPWRNRRA